MDVVVLLNKDDKRMDISEMDDMSDSEEELIVDSDSDQDYLGSRITSHKKQRNIINTRSSKQTTKYKTNQSIHNKNQTVSDRYQKEKQN